MNIRASYCSYELVFKQASGTSRGVLRTKTSYFIKISQHNKVGYGECGLLKGLSIDHLPTYEQTLQWVCDNISLGLETLWAKLIEFPSIQFGLEQAFMSLFSENSFQLFPSGFTDNNLPIAINGLVWMGDEHFMKKQIESVIESGFSCVKLKIGAIDLEQELRLIKNLRHRYSKETLEIRVDANGAFDLETASFVMKKLETFEVHSIEQPLGVLAVNELSLLCSNPPIPVALDESLISCIHLDQKISLLDRIKPQFIILKPSFIGGFKGSNLWISLAEERQIGWWATSALESNIGLNAISQWVFGKNNKMPQGLGTGSLYTNNISSPLYVKKGAIYSSSEGEWNTEIIDKLCM